jgi:hypothetical protein
MRRFDETVEMVEKALDIDPNFPTALTFLALVHIVRKQFDQADALIARIPIKHQYFLAQKGWLDGLVCRRNEALQVLEELKTRTRTSYIAPSLLEIKNDM